MTNLFWETKIMQYITHQDSEKIGTERIVMRECVCVCLWGRSLFCYNFEDSMHQSHVITHLFLNANSLYNCWFNTHVACFVQHNTWYQKCSKCKRSLLSNMTTWGKYEYGTVLQLIIDLIYFRLFRYIYRIISNITWRKYKYRTILQLINVWMCSRIYRIISNIK